MSGDLLRVRSFGVNFHVLRDSKGLYLVDGGFIGGHRQLERVLAMKGWDKLPINGIIVTHGHLDHILNVGRMAEETGAWIAAPRLDAAHYSGKPSYGGLSKLTGILEAVGRPLLGFRPFAADRWLDDGDFLEVWGGLRVVSLPGHTEGHSGLYSEKLKLLFCADLFASFGSWSHLPPKIFNWDEAQIQASVAKALELDLVGVIPNHSDGASPEIHLERLKNLGRGSNE
jgi:glyoxylase-like metal-dependent hydrolase (beta-lactamase superfamily II)